MAGSKMNWTKSGAKTLIRRREDEYAAKSLKEPRDYRFMGGPYDGHTVSDVWKIDPQFCLDQLGIERTEWKRVMGDWHMPLIQSDIERAIMNESREFFRRFRALSKVRPELSPEEIGSMVLKGLGIDNVILGVEIIPQTSEAEPVQNPTTKEQ